MPAPREIMEGYESILDLFNLNIRQRERVIFILCDNLVELACKTKALEHNHKFKRDCSFHDAWNAPGVKLAPDGLGGQVHQRRDTRNTLQHGSAAVTVGIESCADAILDVGRIIDTLWPDTTETNLHLRYKVAQRIVALYASGGDGDAGRRQKFEDAMRKAQWRGDADNRKARVSESIIEPGLREHWRLAVRQSPETVEEILDALSGREPEAGG